MKNLNVIEILKQFPVVIQQLDNAGLNEWKVAVSRDYSLIASAPIEYRLSIAKSCLDSATILKYTPNNLQTKSLIKKAVAINAGALNYANLNLIDTKLAKELIRIDSSCIAKLKQNEDLDFQMYAVKYDYASISYIPNLHPEVIDYLIENNLDKIPGILLAAKSIISNDLIRRVLNKVKNKIRVPSKVLDFIEDDILKKNPLFIQSLKVQDLKSQKLALKYGKDLNFDINHIIRFFEPISKEAIFYAIDLLVDTDYLLDLNSLTNTHVYKISEADMIEIVAYCLEKLPRTSYCFVIPHFGEEKIQLAYINAIATNAKMLNDKYLNPISHTNLFPSARDLLLNKLSEYINANNSSI